MNSRKIDAWVIEEGAFTTPLQPSGLTQVQLTEALLLEALGNPKANRGRYGVAAPELGIRRRSIAVRGDVLLDGGAEPRIMHNPTVLEADFQDTIQWTERSALGEWELKDRPAEVLAQWYDAAGVMHVDTLTGVQAAAFHQAAAQLDEQS